MSLSAVTNEAHRLEEMLHRRTTVRWRCRREAIAGAGGKFHRDTLNPPNRAPMVVDRRPPPVCGPLTATVARPLVGLESRPPHEPTLLEHHHGAEDFTALHPRKGLFDAVEGDRLRDESIQVESALQVEVDEQGEVTRRKAIPVPGWL